MLTANRQASSGAERIVRNYTAARVRYATLDGRQYLVAPLTLVVPGVLNGSKGPLYYPPEEVARDPEQWNHVPIVVYHPTSQGTAISARDPEVLNQQGVGLVMKARIGKNGKLIAEGWFDVEKTKRVDNRVLSALEANHPIELSTGLFTENYEAPKGSIDSKGRPYTYIARNYRPDHLAILPDQVGACSLQDGCGVLVNSDWRKRILGVLNGQIGQHDNPVIGEANMAKLTANQKKSIVDNLVTCNDCGWQEEDREILNAMPDEKLMTMDECRKSMEKKTENLAANAAKIKELEAVANAARKGAAELEPKPVANAEKKPQTEEEWLAAAPANVREDIAFARAEKAARKQAVINDLVANVAEADKARVTNRLKDKSLDELQDLLVLAPKPAGPAPNYAGAAAPAANARSDFDPKDVLPIPTINWAEVSAANQSKRA